MEFLATPQGAASYSRGSVMSVRTALVAAALAWARGTHGQESIHPKDPPKLLVPTPEALGIKHAAELPPLPPRNPWARSTFLAYARRPAHWSPRMFRRISSVSARTPSSISIRRAMPTGVQRRQHPMDDLDPEARRWTLVFFPR
jgi:hypothetical protein